MVIATGSQPAIPPVAGLETVPFWTNESIFDNETLPEHLLIIGGGPIGVEVGQAYRRLGARVTIIERHKAMPKDDPELSRSLLHRLAEEGVVIREDVSVKAATRDKRGIRISTEHAGRSGELSGSHLFIAVGRVPRTEGLDLHVAGVDHNAKGIVVDQHLRTTARGVYAAGDVIDGPRFTHVCVYHAGIIIKNALFRIPAKLDYRSLPWVTFTDPELAQVGMTEQQARERHDDHVRIIRVPYSANDRARTERRSEGLLKVVADRRGRVLGASLFGAHAGELALLWVVAIERGLRLRDLAQIIAPYPTWGEIDKAAAWEFAKLWLARPLTRAALRVLSWLP